MANVIVSVPNFAGDLIMCLPALVGIRKAFPEGAGHKLTILVSESIAPILEAIPITHSTVTYRKKKLRHLKRSCEGLDGFDVSIALTRSWPFVRLFRWLGVPERYGWRQLDLRIWGVNAPVQQPYGSHNPGRANQVELYNHLAAHVARERGVALRLDEHPTLDPGRAQSPVDGLSDLSASSTRLQTSIDKDAAYCVFVPGSSKKAAPKRWPLEGFIALARLLENRLPDLKVAFLLAPGETDLAESLIKGEGLPSNLIIKPPGSTGWQDVISILSRARFVVSNDTGPRHAALALGVRTFTLFGPSDPKRKIYHPHLETPIRVEVGCTNSCRSKRCVYSHQCMSVISPQHVYSVLEGSRLLQEMRMFTGTEVTATP